MKTFAIPFLFLLSAGVALAGYRTLQDENRFVTVKTETIGVESVWFCYPDKLECDVTTTNVSPAFAATIRIEPHPDWELLDEDGTGIVPYREIVMHPGDEVRYRVRHRDTGELSPWGLVVMFRVDAVLAGVEEESEETEGAFLPEIPSALSPEDEAFRSACRPLRFALSPRVPPTPDFATLTWHGVRLFEVSDDGTWTELRTDARYRWNELEGKDVRVAGSLPSETERDRWIRVEHDTNKCADTARCTVVRVDMDIDTSNTQGTSEPLRTEQEDLAEESTAKIIQMNDLDADGDYIPDYLDGFGLFSGSHNDNEVENGKNFVPLIVECSPISDGFSIRFDYDCPNEPNNTGISTMEEAAQAFTNAVSANPLGSGIRIWSKNEGEERNPAPLSLQGDFVMPGVSIPIRSLFSSGNHSVRLYIEGIGTSSDWSQCIQVSVCDRNGNVIVSDTVAYCVVRCSFQIYVYRPYVYEGTHRYEFCADYASPQTMFSSFCRGAKMPDDKYHESADFLGHAFARIQSRTPSEHIDILTGQTGMNDKKKANFWNGSLTDALTQLRAGTIYWFSFPDGRENTQGDLDVPIKLFLGEYDDGIAIPIGGGHPLRLTAMLEYRVRPETITVLQAYRQTHNFSKYGLDATINDSDPRCGCGSYVAILAQRAGFGKFPLWTIDVGMPIISLSSPPSSLIDAMWSDLNEVIDECEREFLANPKSASWGGPETRSLRFADPALMASWIDLRNAVDPVVNQPGRNQQTVILQHTVPNSDNLSEWNR